MKIINIDSKNLTDYPIACFCKKDSPGYNKKIEWIKKRSKEGLKIKVLIDPEDKNRMHGFIEYIDGKNAYRAVDCKDYFFIHCIWINPNKYKKKGHGSSLIKEVENEAKKQKKLGVAVITSSSSFMADKNLFLKNKFKIVQEIEPYNLLVKNIKKGPQPKFKKYKKQLEKLKGWHIIYSNQCPWVSKFIEELDKNIIKKLNIKITELKTPKQAQNAPSIYSAFTLVKDGKILAEHYISNTRFNNILKKES